VTRLQARLDDLRAQDAELSPQAPHEATRAPTAPDLAAVADELERVIAKPQKAKALLRLLIEELRVNGRKEILPTYRVVTPAVRAMSEKWRRRESNPRNIPAVTPGALGGASWVEGV
jgi:hypothetical protein